MNDLKLATGINRPWLQSLSGNYFGGNCPYFSIPFISFCILLSSNFRIYFNLCALQAGFSYDLKTSGISNQIIVATSRQNTSNRGDVSKYPSLSPMFFLRLVYIFKENYIATRSEGLKLNSHLVKVFSFLSGQIHDSHYTLVNVFRV